MNERTKHFMFNRWTGWRGFWLTVAFVLLMVGIGLTVPRLIGAAYGTDEASPAPATHISNFNAGEYGRVDGLQPHKLFATPSVAKEVWVDKIVHRMQGLCKTAAAKDPCRTQLCDRCRAYELYYDMINNANCSGRGALSTTNAHLCAVKYSSTQSGPQLTKKQIQVGGTAVLCGGAVAIAVRGGAGFWAGIFGGVGCGWALWTQLDPG